MNTTGRHQLKSTELDIARWRFVSVMAVLSVLVVCVVWHVAQLQVVPGEDKGFEFLQGQGDARTVRREEIPAYRGVITDKHGEPLAVSTPVITLWANPAEIGVNAPLAAMARALSTTEVKLRAKLKKYANKEFIYLRRHLSPHQAEIILANNWPGLYGSRDYKRFYPAGEVTSHIVGFTDIDEVGQEGLELAFNDWLEGSPGAKRVIKDLKGRVIKDAGLIRAPQSGRDLRLSIDLRIQYLAHRELKRAVKEHRAQSGSIVLLDVKTGEVLAMANQPSYNPNNRSKLDPAAVRNRAVTDLFEPGSTMKPLTVMAALESGKYNPKSVIDTSPGYIRVNNKTLLDPINYGVIDLTKVITKSSQVGITKVALDLEFQTIRDIYQRLGLGSSTGVGFPGEGVGVLPNKSRWTDIERANFAFGYGVSLTGLQLAQAYSVIASHGVKKDLSLLRQDQLPQSSRVLAKKVAQQIIEMLKTVPQPGGTGKRAQIESFPVAGKTGTVHKVGRNGYADARYLSIFAGMAPADDPKVVAVVIIDEPSAGKYFGGEVAAPVFSKVVEGALRLMHVPPQSVPTMTASSEVVKKGAAI